uniref:PHD-type domain-containing protein n=1 Tax=Sphaeramia orbicularis TaxID=375764 RepID=A0A673BQ63_9TELE
MQFSAGSRIRHLVLPKTASLIPISFSMREMVGGCCVCSDERGWAENPLVYCDGHGCSVAVHQACYGIVQVPTGPWFCRKCESQERAARVVTLKRTDSGGKYFKPFFPWCPSTTPLLRE